MRSARLPGLGALVPLALSLPAAAAIPPINFHDSFADSFGNGPRVFVGQGAAPDPGNNTWNGFAGNAAASRPAHASDGSLTLVTATVNYGFTNGGAFPADQGMPQFLLGNSLVANGANPTGTFTLANVAPGAYDLYLYGSNYDHNRGTMFTVSSGAAHTGINATLNSTLTSYVEGVNYVLFQGVTPDASGTISGTWQPNPADGVGNPNLPGEGNFNGLQLVPVQVSAGACCIAAGCALGGSAACAAAGGTFHGVDSTCAAANCPLPGACCVGCTGCYITSSAGCTGQYRGNGATCAAAGCSINNGDFETGDFSGWTQFGDMSYTTVIAGLGDDGITMPHGGSNLAEFGPGPPGGGGIQQVIPAHTGDQVTIGFWFTVPGGAPNYLSVVFDSQTLLTLTDDTSHNTWTQFMFTRTASVDNPVLSFTFYNVPSWSNLDDVTVCITGATGACCSGATCTVTTQAACTGPNTRYTTSGQACNAPGNNTAPCCKADFNQSGGPPPVKTVQDLFDFLAAWFAKTAQADINGNPPSSGSANVTVQDLFDFLAVWFPGCP